MDFAKLKQAKKGNTDFTELTKKAEAAAGSGDKYEKDPRYLIPKTDAEGNGLVIFRFLPHAEVDGENYADYVTLYNHGFKGIGGWYIENSLTTIPDPNSKYGMPDPVSDANRRVFAELGKEEAIKFLRTANRNRQTKYIANILVLKNDLEPETVGKVMLYKFGVKVLNKILAKLVKDLEDDIVFDAFNMWEGANFRLKMKKVDGQRSYEDSSFDNPTPLYGGDDARLEVVYGQLHSLAAEIAPDKFKTYEELEKRFLAVTQAPKQETAENDNPVPTEHHKQEAPKKEPEPKASVPAEKPKSAYFDDEDADLPF